MTKIKMCGIRRKEDVEFVNSLLPEYIGYVFAQKSKRYITPENALELTKMLDKRITPVGVFVNEDLNAVAELLKNGTIEIAQLHGTEDDSYIEKLRELTGKTIFKAFKIKSAEDIENANISPADYVLLDSGEGSGETFDHSLINGIDRPYFLAGGLTPENVSQAVKILSPFGVDASSSLETDGFKDSEKMRKFTDAVRSV